MIPFRASAPSDISVAFFPIERFLTPTLKTLFLKNPAGFFVPGELMSDPKTPTAVRTLLLALARSVMPSVGETELIPKMLRASLEKCDSADEEKLLQAQETGRVAAPQGVTEHLQMCGLKEIVGGLSLNNVHVVVGGIMTLDVAAVPASIYEVTFADGNDNKELWTVPGKDRKGTISGVYLAGGTPSIVDAKGTPVDGITIKPVPASSSDTALNFTMSASKCIPSQQLYFVVTKSPDPSGSTDSAAAKTTKASAGVQSSPFQFAVQPYTCPTTPAAAPDPAKTPVKEPAGGPAKEPSKAK